MRYRVHISTFCAIRLLHATGVPRSTSFLTILFENSYSPLYSFIKRAFFTQRSRHISCHSAFARSALPADQEFRQSLGFHGSLNREAESLPTSPRLRRTRQPAWFVRRKQLRALSPGPTNRKPSCSRKRPDPLQSGTEVALAALWGLDIPLSMCSLYIAAATATPGA